MPRPADITPKLTVRRKATQTIVEFNAAMRDRCFLPKDPDVEIWAEWELSAGVPHFTIIRHKKPDGPWVSKFHVSHANSGRWRISVPAELREAFDKYMGLDKVYKATIASAMITNLMVGKPKIRVVKNEGWK